MPTFEEYVSEWDALAGEKAKLEKKLKPIKDREIAMRKEIVAGLVQTMGDQVKEGVNKFVLPDGRTLKFNYKLERKVDEALLPAVKEEYAALNSATVPFDDLLRVKYEIDKRSFNKLADAALLTFSKMVTTRETSPELTIE